MEIVSDMARLSETSTEFKALNPSSLFDNSINPDFKDKESGLSLTEQLYTARGAQGAGMYKKV